MTIEKIQNGNALTIALGGRLDTMSAPELETTLKDALIGVEELTFDFEKLDYISTTLKDALIGVEELTFDFEKLDYISSAGLRVLLTAQKTMNRQGSMKVQHVNEIISEIFEVTGFSDILTIA